ncbi:zf-HC2 domain-containing protein [Corynebacterium timonense]|uniref:Predicted anti-sigma-YlaC factor YlaD, contains Zn-finger domain n=1 Tax=Corynebacterium timonense TaxID=441500 RepID=A0A1H1R1B7_9CORY|nr:zf-HC2 domain-containing protein [Corynebacterium timonense]SDS29305.1 Predicted anti-sigma-YlaC factor YlaD, contains Zn-finger domain [Corynebacterium timonense]
MLSHEDVQAALSARLDGEGTGLDDAIVDAHLAQCEECRAYWDRLVALSKNLRFAEVGGGMAPPPDLSEAILAGVESEWRRFSRRRFLLLSLCRVALVVAAIVWGVWAVNLVAAGAAPDVAAVRFGVALALAFAAWKPTQIPGILLIVGTMFTFTLGFTVRDLLLDSARGTAGPLVIQLFSFLVLVATWATDRGADVRRAWRLLGADPA